jgi:hypothetical protein
MNILASETEAFQMAPKNKIAIFFKNALAVLIEF